jgi:hypothetical protein
VSGSVTTDQRVEPAIYLHSFELTRDIMVLTRNFPKPTRYVLGRSLDEKVLAFLLMLNGVVGPSGVSNDQRARRLELLTDLSRELDGIRILLRLSRELGALSAGQNQVILDKLAAIGRQLGGLIRTARTAH